MAIIGLDNLYYAKITEDENGQETYDSPKKLAKAIKVGLSVEISEAILYADNGAAETVKAFKSGKLKLEIDKIGTDAARDLTGAEVDSKGVLVYSGENNAPYVAIGFRAKNSDGKYRYFWLYKTKFAVPGTDVETQGDSINFQTPTIEGTILQREKPAGTDRHPWKVEATEGDTNLDDSVISGWFTSVYEPTFTA